MARTISIVVVGVSGGGRALARRFGPDGAMVAVANLDAAQEEEIRGGHRGFIGTGFLADPSAA
jgi:hypothetical protein